MTLTLVNLADQDAALPFPWSRIKRTLDSLEARFLRSGLRLQSERVQALRPVVEEALRRGLVPATIDLEGNFLDLVEAYVGQVLVEGIVQGDADVRAEERRARAAGVNLKVDGEAVIPKEAIAFLESRRDLNRFFDADQVEKVRTILGNSLREGATVKQTMDALQTALPGASRARLENIARTEATAAYNQGRVYRFLQSKGFIQAVRFDAILDSRVTDICQHRNGLLFALDDPRLRQNTPPLHYQCRSVLTPISGYKLEKMGGKARLDADRAKMATAPDPQLTKKGRFGNEPWPDVQGGGAAPMPRVKPVGPKPVAPGGYTKGRLPTTIEEQAGIGGGGRKYMPPELDAGAKQSSKSGRSGRSYIGPNGMEPKNLFPYKQADFEQAVQAYRPALEAGVLPGLDARDVEMVFRYVWWPRGESVYVLERIAEGGLDGLALLAHEATELRQYFLDGRYNPWKLGEQRRGYRWNHGFATLEEHRLMLKVAQQKGYAVDNVWDMIRTDANAVAPDVDPFYRPAQVKRNLKAAGSRVGLTLDEIPPSRPESLAEAERFWQDVMAGRLKLVDVDFVAIQDDGRL